MKNLYKYLLSFTVLCNIDQSKTTLSQDQNVSQTGPINEFYDEDKYKKCYDDIRRLKKLFYICQDFIADKIDDRDIDDLSNTENDTENDIQKDFTSVKILLLIK